MHVPLLVTQFLDRANQLYGEKVAVIDGEKSVTYDELYHRVQQLSHGLSALGVRKGDRVAYLAPNTLEMLEGFYGVFQLGAVMVPLNIRLKPEDYLYILNHSESKILLVDYELYPLIEPIEHELKTVEAIIVHNGQVDGHLEYDEWLKNKSKFPFSRPEIDEEEVCSLLYTSGTTGKPKGVMLTHRNNYLHALSTMHHLRVTDEDVYLHILPMFHVNGWGAPFYYTANGATHICLRKAIPADIFEKVEKYDVTVMHMAPTVLNSLLQYVDQEKVQVKENVRVVIAGSAPPPQFVKRVENELKWEFIQVYGMTESSPLSLVSTIRSHLKDTLKEDKHRMKAKAGYSMIGCEVKVVDEKGEEVKWDGKQIGEVVTRSNGVMKGYWKNEEATMNTIKNGWLHTGDMATVDEFGHIDIVDRKKDIIISGGENISSIEVEGVLYEHPAVQEAAVIAIPHEKWGETPHAFVVLKEGKNDVTEKDIIDFARDHLAHFKAPTSVTFVSELPKTASGKIQKVHLRKQYWEGRERLVN